MTEIKGSVPLPPSGNDPSSASSDRTLSSAMHSAGSSLLRVAGDMASEAAMGALQIGSVVAAAAGMGMIKVGLTLAGATFIPGIVDDVIRGDANAKALVVPGSAPRPPGAMPRSPGELQKLFQEPQSIGDISLIGSLVAVTGMVLCMAGGATMMMTVQRGKH